MSPAVGGALDSGALFLGTVAVDAIVCATTAARLVVEFLTEGEAQ